jgi:cysteate synthase
MNAPFLPMHDAWKAGSRDLLPLDDQLARKQVDTILAKVLSNRKPPYSITGGLFDALTDTGGDFIAVNNEEALAADRLFRETEGIDLHPAAAVAVASLVRTCNRKEIDTNATIMLNVTGGGEELFKQGRKLHYLKPSLVFDINPSLQTVEQQLLNLFG